MELLAVIVSLENLRSKGHKVDIYSDSKYVVDSVSKGWLAGWVAKGFKDKKNPDLWRRYIEAAKGQYVSFHWIKGHNKHPENERCDALAVAAATGQAGPLLRFRNRTSGIIHPEFPAYTNSFYLIHFGAFLIFHTFERTDRI